MDVAPKLFLALNYIISMKQKQIGRILKALVHDLLSIYLFSWTVTTFSAIP